MYKPSFCGVLCLFCGVFLCFCRPKWRIRSPCQISSRWSCNTSIRDELQVRPFTWRIIAWRWRTDNLCTMWPCRPISASIVHSRRPKPAMIWQCTIKRQECQICHPHPCWNVDGIQIGMPKVAGMKSLFLGASVGKLAVNLWLAPCSKKTASIYAYLQPNCFTFPNFPSQPRNKYLNPPTLVPKSLEGPGVWLMQPSQWPLNQSYPPRRWIFGVGNDDF